MEYYVEVNHRVERNGHPGLSPIHGQRARSGPFRTRDEAERFARAVAGSTPIWSAEIVELDAEGEAGAA